MKIEQCVAAMLACQFSTGVLAQSGNGANDCSAIAAPTVRLACYDSREGTPAQKDQATKYVSDNIAVHGSAESRIPEAARPVESVVTTSQAAKSPSVRFVTARENSIAETKIYVRQSATLEADSLELAKQPAMLSVTRSNGRDTASIQGGVLVLPGGTRTLGWQPFFSAGWNRDTSGTKPKDFRVLGVGALGPIFSTFDATNPKKAGLQWSAHGALRLTTRKSLYDATDANTFGAHVDFIVNRLQDPSGFAVTPHIGYVANNLYERGTGNGSWQSTYIGFVVAYKLGPLIPNLAATLVARRYVDVSVPRGQEKRRSTYANLVFKYNLFDPEKESTALRPFLTLSREVGADYFTGRDEVRRTVLGLGVTYN